MTVDWVFRKCTGKDLDYWIDCAEVHWYRHYADPREDSGKGVLTANWNHFPRSLARQSHISAEGKAAQDFNWGKGRKFQDILEHMGYHLEWNDQTDRCDHCDGCIQTSAHCYGDTAHYALLGSDSVCEHCIRKDFAEEYLQGLEDNPRTALHIDGISLEEHGYERIQDGFENGFHPGQNDDPVKIYQDLHKQGYRRIVFAIDDAGQFDLKFSVWHKAGEE